MKDKVDHDVIIQLSKKIREYRKKYKSYPESANISKDTYQELCRIFKMSMTRTTPLTVTIDGLNNGIISYDNTKEIVEAMEDLRDIMCMYFIVNNTDSDIELDKEKIGEGYTKARIIEIETSENNWSNIETDNKDADIIDQIFIGLRRFASKRGHMPDKLEINSDDMLEVLHRVPGTTKERSKGAPKVGATFRMLSIDWVVCDVANIRMS
jgi:hypothetical protein